ncbi:Mut7-C RNAse domain-containing protein [Pontibacter sp. H249]|uniref:Mut7-C RNAse domain-containing protein n=1 Tax=Pontibacter sp. H249 TaxID=3133420 RepID=UPI0030BBFFD1
MPSTAIFTFHSVLQDFLKPAARKVPVVYTFNGSPALKDAIEAMGIPHTEVAAILKNDAPATFSASLRHHDKLQVYPLDQSKVWPTGYSLRSEPLKPYRFVLDVHLGSLAKVLRMLGFDVVYHQSLHDTEIAQLAQAEQRIVLTRDIGLLKQKIIEHGYWLRSQQTEQQLQEVVSRYELQEHFKPLIRCLRCNELIRQVPKQEVLHKLPPKTRLYFHDFYYCSPCDKVYWKGSHYEHMMQVVQQLKIKLLPLEQTGL